jgi:beta-hydroxylase
MTNTNDDNFLDPELFPFLKEIKDGYKTIYDEFKSTPDISKPWGDTKLYGGGWDVIGFRYEGIDFPENKSVFPKTNEIFESLKDRLYTCGFSILRPGCEIREHVNYNHDVLRCHLCLYTNDNCALVVNDEARNWKAGELLVFDDTKKHSAYNRGDTERVIVLFDFYK